MKCPVDFGEAPGKEDPRRNGIREGIKGENGLSSVSRTKTRVEQECEIVDRTDESLAQF